jgi:UDP-N-acetyl-2-amino-2-deoxyglucuronate dehydrogenase
MKTWNFGIVGAGLIADFHARAIGDIPNTKLVGCCDKLSDRAKKLADKYGVRAFEDYEQMLQSDDIDIVTIATPSGFHAEPTIAAAGEGKHVICEKPLEITLERIDLMIEAHEKAGTRLGGIFPYRFNDMMVPIREAINSGRLGRHLCPLVADRRILQGLLARDMETRWRRRADEPVHSHGRYALRRHAAHRIGAGIHS